MSNLGLASFIAGFGGGYLNQQRRNEDLARQEKMDAITLENHAFQKAQNERLQKQQAEDDAYKAESKAALSQGSLSDGVSINGGSGNGLMFKQASDPVSLGLQEEADMRAEQAGAPGAVSQLNAVPAKGLSLANGTGKIFTDPDQAKAASLSLSTDAARTQAMRSVAQKFGKVDADEALRKKLKSLQDEGVIDAAKLIGQGKYSEAAQVFQNSGAMRLPDGVDPAKVTGEKYTYKDPVTGIDATTHRIFDGNGNVLVDNSRQMLLSELSPKDQIALEQKGVELTDGKRKTDAAVTESNAKARYYDSLSSAKDTAASGQADKPIKMDEDAKILFQESNKAVHEANRALNDAMSKLMPTDDPEKAPAVIHAKKLVEAANKNQFKTGVQVGAITPEKVANDFLGVAKTPGDAMKMLTQLANTVGADFADQVAMKVKDSDVWARMTPQPKPTSVGLASGKSIPAAPTPRASLAQQEPAQSQVIYPSVRPVRANGEPPEVYRRRLVAWDEARMAQEAAIKAKQENDAREAARQAAIAARPGLSRMLSGARF